MISSCRRGGMGKNKVVIQEIDSARKVKSYHVCL